jgi:hypothetical protein
MPYRMKTVYVAKDYVEKNADVCANFTAEEDRGGQPGPLARRW